MNRYERYLEVKNFDKEVRCLEDAEEYLKNCNNDQKFYLHSKLVGMFEFILKQKQYEENLKAKTKYSDSDIEFLKEFDVIDLTHYESFLTKRKEEHYDWMRALSFRIFLCNPKQRKYIEEEIDKLGDNYTPRLIINIIKNAKKK